MQNPVTTVAWLAAHLSLLGPLVSLTIDTKDFCLGLIRTRLVLLFSLVQVIMAFLVVLLRPNTHVNYVSTYLKLYSFGQAFRLEAADVTVAGMTGYAIVVNTSRRLLGRLQRSRVHPV